MRAPEVVHRREPVRLSPKNGKHLVLLLAGGPADRARELAAQLAETRGAEVRHHWSWEHEHEFARPLPLDVDLVVVLRDMIGHSCSGRVRSAAAAVNVPVVMTSHKWAILDQALRVRFGFRKLPALHPVKLPQAPPPLSVVRPAEPPPLPVNEPLVTGAPPATQADMPLRAALRADTMALLQELQARMAALEIDSVLVERDQVTFSTPRPNGH